MSARKKTSTFTTDELVHREKVIAYYALPQHRCGATEWFHKDFTYSWLGTIGFLTLAHPTSTQRGFETEEEAIEYAKEMKNKAIEEWAKRVTDLEGDSLISREKEAV